MEIKLKKIVDNLRTATALTKPAPADFGTTFTLRKIRLCEQVQDAHVIGVHFKNDKTSTFAMSGENR